MRVCAHAAGAECVSVDTIRELRAQLNDMILGKTSREQPFAGVFADIAATEAEFGAMSALCDITRQTMGTTPLTRRFLVRVERDGPGHGDALEHPARQL